MNSQSKVPCTSLPRAFGGLLTAVCIGAVLALPAFGQVYQWKDAEGRNVVSDTPPSGAKAKQIGRAAPVSPAKQGADSADGKKAASEKEAKEKTAEEKRLQAVQEYCDSARKYLAQLGSGARIASTDAKGDRYIMTDEQRSAEAAKLRQGMQEAKCQ